MIATIAVLALVASGNAEPRTAIPDASLGLSKTSVFEVPTPPPVKAEDSVPGEKRPAPRVFAGTPPVIPHGIADLLPITREQNLCVDCHGVKEKNPGEAIPIPASHYRDLRHAPRTARKEIAGARHVCTACHVPRTDAEPLVRSTFRP
jgi:nitrate reductase (cytochrome), electron transfer subunit